MERKIEEFTYHRLLNVSIFVYRNIYLLKFHKFADFNRSIPFVFGVRKVQDVNVTI
jgi:hypothetical protein